MREFDVKRALRHSIVEEFCGDPGTLILDEMGVLNGRCRIDFAVVNGMLRGYEIKSDADTLERLPDQCEAYNAVFDRLVLVVGSRHIQASLTLVPDWWGIYEAKEYLGTTTLLKHRNPLENLLVDGDSLARLLWRDELIITLEEIGVKAVRNKALPFLRSKLCETVPLPDLKGLVRRILKQRESWRSDALRM